MAENQALINNQRETDVTNGIVQGQEAHKCNGDCNEHPETVLDPCLEKDIKEKDPKLYRIMTSAKGMLAQQGLCVIMVLLNAYEVLAKGLGPGYYKGTDIPPFQFSSIQMINVVMSIVLGFLLAAYNGQMKTIFCMDFVKMQCQFIIPAVLFSIGQSLSYLAQSNVFFPPDVAKVLDQMRLLMTAIVSLAMFGKMPSRATWNSLILITFAAAVYTMTARLNAEIASLKAGKVTDSSESDGYNYPAGVIVVFINCVVMCVASVAAEKFLKAYKKVPFYVQKICLESPNIIWVNLIWNPYLSPALNYCIWAAVGELDRYNKMEAAKANKPKGSFFDGFVVGNLWLWVLMFTFCAKSYLNGIIVKQMSSVVKQICQIT